MLTYCRKFILHSKCLHLHSSAVNAEDDPRTEVCPNGCNRSKKATLSKAEANKRSLKEATLAEMARETSTPTKKVS